MKIIRKIIKRELGCPTLGIFKQQMKNAAALNEYGAICYTEEKNGVTFNYSDNCKSKFGVSMTINGRFVEVRFN